MYDKERSLKKKNNMEDEMDLKRGPWTAEEDLKLMNYIATNGEGRWNSLSRRAGLQRTGKSCRLRWLNYLCPDIRRGNITLEEQLLILQLHSHWGNRWSKIAQHLPGRTDNEIKNYWRTRVQKHAKQLKCDVNSQQFKDIMKYLWMPQLVERIKSASDSAAYTSSTTSNNQSMNYYNNNNNMGQQFGVVSNNDYINPENSSLTVSPASNTNSEYYLSEMENSYYPDQNLVNPLMFEYSGLLDKDLMAMQDQSSLNWFENIDGGASSSDSLWNIGESGEDFWF